MRIRAYWVERESLWRRNLWYRRSKGSIPHLFTCASIVFGFVSLIRAAHSDWVGAAYCILSAALMDALDGRIARRLNCASELGLQLDSLADAISFCLAPALLVYLWVGDHCAPYNIISCMMFLLAGVIRLARFNVGAAEQKQYFRGVPTTMAACILVLVLLYAHALAVAPWAVLFTLALLALLMVSSVPVPTFKRYGKVLRSLNRK